MMSCNQQPVFWGGGGRADGFLLGFRRTRGALAIGKEREALEVQSNGQKRRTMAIHGYHPWVLLSEQKRILCHRLPYTGLIHGCCSVHQTFLYRARDRNPCGAASIPPRIIFTSRNFFRLVGRGIGFARHIVAVAGRLACCARMISFQLVLAPPQTLTIRSTQHPPNRTAG
ncbi:hypothetical protein EJ06DRAFT_403996 [Trichodelitschia bisporula]|uniref:Uncharacterized protein n=1 Tax=Trichodelitschia bisporula TaxID=703511 RepID=A0A6G1HXW0_9PEZI|nr:hypothetical protein EJ06DRAFT_403996 [Trichodelitschia bisporula]